MKCDLSLLTIVITTLFTLIFPNGIDCCSSSYTINEIISLTSQPDYQRNPCYIQWKAEQDAKWQELWKRRDDLEKSIRNNEENERRTYNNRPPTDTSTAPVKKKTLWLVLVIIFGVLLGIGGCGLCISIYQSDDDLTALPYTTTPRNDLNASGTPVVMTPVVTIDAPTNQITLPTNNAIGTENRRPSSREANVPLLPRGVIKRQNSLPSYDDAVRMPSAPPKE